MIRATNAAGEILTELHVLTVQDAIAVTLDQASKAGRTIKVLADETRIPGSRLYTCFEGRHRLRAEEVPAIVRATGNPLIVATIARACGGTFVPLPSSPSTLASDLKVASDAMQQFSETLQAFSDALSDGRMRQDEADRVSREGHDAVTAILALIEHAQHRAHGPKEIVTR